MREIEKYVQRNIFLLYINYKKGVSSDQLREVDKFQFTTGESLLDKGTPKLFR